MANRLRKDDINQYERSEPSAAPRANPASYEEPAPLSKQDNRTSSVTPSIPSVDTGYQSKVSKNGIYTDPLAGAVKVRGVKSGSSNKPLQSVNKGDTTPRWEMNSTRYRMPDIDMGTSIEGLSASDAWHRINSRAYMYANSRTDEERAANLGVLTTMWNAYQIGQESPGSAFYNPYTKPTNKAYAALAEMGIDATQLTTQQLQEMVGAARYTQTGNSPAAPTKTSTREENAAYWAYQILNNQDRTQKAVDELADVQRRVEWYVQQGLSDSEITKRIQQEYDSNTFSTLRNMDNERTTGSYTVLNQAVDWMGMDSVQGMIWSARNGGQTLGNSMMNAGAARYGLGTQYKANAEAEAMRDASNADTYNPYASGTTLEDEALQFGTASFDANWLTANRSLLNGTDAERKAYNNIAKAVANSDAAQTELDALNAWAQKQIDNGKTWEQIQAAMEKDSFWNDYKTLKKMEDGRTSGKPLSMGYAVDFSLPRWEAQIRQATEKPEESEPMSVTEYTTNPRGAYSLHEDVKRYMRGDGANTAFGQQFIQDYGFLFPQIKDFNEQGYKNMQGYVKSGIGYKDVTGATVRGLLKSVADAAASGYLSNDDLADYYVKTAMAYEQAQAAGMTLDQWVSAGNAPELTSVNDVIDQRRIEVDQDNAAFDRTYKRSLGTQLGTAYDNVINGTATEEEQGYYNYMAHMAQTSGRTVVDQYNWHDVYDGVRVIYDPAVRDTIRAGLEEDLITEFGDNFDTDLYRHGISEVAEAIAAMVAASPEMEKISLVASALGTTQDEVSEIMGWSVDTDAIIAREKQAFYDTYAPGFATQRVGEMMDRDATMSAMTSGAQAEARAIQEARGGYQPEDEDTRHTWASGTVGDLDVAYDDDMYESVQNEVQSIFNAKYNDGAAGVAREGEIADAAAAVAALMYENGEEDVTTALETLVDKIQGYIEDDGMSQREAIAQATQDTAQEAHDAFTARTTTETGERTATAMEEKYGDTVRPFVWGAAQGWRSYTVSKAEDAMWWLSGGDEMEIQSIRARYQNDPQAYKAALIDAIKSGRIADPNELAFAQFAVSDDFQGDIFTTGLLGDWQGTRNYIYSRTQTMNEVSEHMQAYGTTVENLLFTGATNVAENSLRMGEAAILNTIGASVGLGVEGTVGKWLWELGSTTVAYGLAEGRELGQELEKEYGVSHEAAMGYGFVQAIGTGLLEKLQMEKYIPGGSIASANIEAMEDLAKAGLLSLNGRAKMIAFKMLMAMPEEGLQEGTENLGNTLYSAALHYLYSGDAEKLTAMYDTGCEGYLGQLSSEFDAKELGQSILMGALTAPFLTIEGALLGGDFKRVKPETQELVENIHQTMTHLDTATPEQQRQMMIDMATAMQDPEFLSALQAASDTIITSESVVSQIANGALSDILTGKEASVRNDAKANLDRATEQRDRDAAQVQQMTEALSALTQQIVSADVVTEDMAQAVQDAQTNLEEASKQAEASTQAYDDAQAEYNAADQQFGAIMKERIAAIREQAQAEKRGEKNAVPRTPLSNFAAQTALAESRAALSGTTLDKAKAKQAHAAANMAAFTAMLNEGNISPSKIRAAAPRFVQLQKELAAANAEVEQETVADVKKRFPAQARLQSAIQTMQETEYESPEYNRASNDAAMAGAQSKVIQAERAVETARANMDASNLESVQQYERAQQELKTAQAEAENVGTRLAADTKRRAAAALRENGYENIADALESRNVSEIRDALAHMREDNRVNIREAAEAAGIDWQSNEYRPASDETLQQLDKARRNKPGLTDTTTDKRKAEPGIKAQKRVLNALAQKYGFEIVLVDSLEGRFNGMYRGGRTVYVAADAVEGALVQTAMHEAVHMLKAKNAVNYQTLEQTVREALGDGFDWQGRTMAIMQGTDMTEEAAVEEIVAEATAAVFADKTALQSIMKKDGGTTLRRIADALRGFWDDLKALVTRYAGAQKSPEIQRMLEAGQDQMNAVASAMDYALGGDVETLMEGDEGWQEARDAVLEERKDWHQRRAEFERQMNDGDISAEPHVRYETVEEYDRAIADVRGQMGTIVGAPDSKYTSLDVVEENGEQIATYAVRGEGQRHTLPLDSVPADVRNDIRKYAALRDQQTELVDQAWSMQNNTDIPVIDTSAPVTLEDGTKVATDAQALGMAQTEDGAPLLGDLTEEPKYSRRSMVGYQTDGSIEMDTETGYYMNGDLYKIRQALSSRIGTNQQIMTQEEIDDLTRSVQSVVDYIDDHQAFRMVLDHNWDLNNEDRAFSPVKQNADKHYKAAVDFSTLCRKRVTLQMIAEELAARTGRAVTPEEGAVLRDYLKDIQKELNTVEVACALCYVEAARNNSVKFQNEFLENREAALRTYFSLKDSQWTRMVLQAEQNRYRAENNVEQRGANPNKGDLTAAQRTEYEALTRRLRQERQLTEREQAIVDAAIQMDPSMFLTADGLKRLKIENPDVYGAYIAYVVSRAKAKSMEMEVPYLLGDLTAKIRGKKLVGPALIKAMNLESGLRHQSWSDLETKHILDTITAIVDMSLNGAKAHTYTKVPDMIRLIGKTNMMANMSLIPLGETGMQNGELAFDPVEGMPWETMLELRDQYRMTAGNIAIGINDEQIQAMMESDLIDYIIPYHVSGMSAEMRKTLGIEAWRDATQIQNEKTRDSSKPAGKAPALREWFDIDEGLSDEWRDRPYEYMEYCAQRYLELCEKRNLVPKFEKYSGRRGYWKMLVDRKMIAQAVGNEPAVLIRQEVVKPVFDQQTMLDIMQREVDSGRMQEQQEAIRRTVNAVLSGELSLSEEMDELIKKFANDQYEITSAVQQSDIADNMEAMTNQGAIADQAARASYIESAIDRRLAEDIRNDASYELGRYMEQSVMADEAKALADQRVQSGEWINENARAAEDAALAEQGIEVETAEQPAEKPRTQAKITPNAVQRAMGVQPSMESNAAVQRARERTARTKATSNVRLRSPIKVFNELAHTLGIATYTNMRQRNVSETRPEARLLGVYSPLRNFIELTNMDTHEYSVSMHEVGHGISQMIDMTATPEMAEELNETQGEAFAEFVATYMFNRDSAIDLAGVDFVADFEDRLHQQRGAWRAVQRAQAQVQAYARATAQERGMASMIERRDTQHKRKGEIGRRIFSWQNAAEAAKKVDNLVSHEGAQFRNGERVATLNEAMRYEKHIPKVASVIIEDALVDIAGNRIGDGLGMVFANSGVTAENAQQAMNFLKARHVLERYAEWRNSREALTEAQAALAQARTPEARAEAQNAVRRAETRVAESGRDTSMSEADAQRIVDDGMAEFGDLSENLSYWWYHQFMPYWAVRMNTMTQEQLDAMEDKYKYYVPSYRDVSDFAEYGVRRRGRSGNGAGWTYHGLADSDLDTITPMDTIPEIISAMVQRAAKNRVAQTLYYQLAGAQTNAAGTNNVGRLSDIGRISSVNEITDEDTVLVDTPNTGSNIITVYLPGGRRATIELQDQLLYDVMTSEGSGATPSVLVALQKVKNTMSSLTTGRDVAFGGKNALADTSHLIPYSIDAEGRPTSYTAIDHAARWARAAVQYTLGTNEHLRVENDTVNLYRRQGGGGNTYAGSTKAADLREQRAAMFAGWTGSDTKDRIAGAAARVLDFATFQRVNEISEQTSRFVAYQRSLEHYRAEYGDTEWAHWRAFLDAQDATVDFAQGGYTQGYRFLRRITPFMNPNMQGAYQMGTMIRDAFGGENVTIEARNLARARLAHYALHYGLKAATQFAMLHCLFDDDDRKAYEMMAEDMRTSNLLIPARWLGGQGERTFIRLPIGQGGLDQAVYGAWLKGFGQFDDDMDLSLMACISRAIGDATPWDVTSGVTFDGTGRMVLNPDATIEGLTRSTILGPAIGLAFNRNWYGGQIDPASQQKYDESQRYYDSTPTVLVNLSEDLSAHGIKISPLKLQYLTEQYGGIIGKYVLPLMSRDPATGKWDPAYAWNKTWRVVRNRFTTDPAYSNDADDRYDYYHTQLTEIQNANKVGKDLPDILPSMDRDEVMAAATELLDLYKQAERDVSDITTELIEINNDPNKEYGQKQLEREQLQMQAVQIEAAWTELAEAFFDQYGSGSLLYNLITGKR